MKLRFTNQFEKQLDRISDKRIQKQITKALQELKNAPTLSSVTSINKIKGFSHAYRIRSGGYRIGLFEEQDGYITVAHIDVRGSFYKRFP